MNVYCVVSLESPQRGDSNEYTQYTISQYKKKIILNDPKSAYGICCVKKGFETAVVNEPSVFEPLRFYCIRFSHFFHLHRKRGSIAYSLSSSFHHRPDMTEILLKRT